MQQGIRSDVAVLPWDNAGHNGKLRDYAAKRWISAKNALPDGANLEQI
jgi:hypothetical protein